MRKFLSFLLIFLVVLSVPLPAEAQVASEQPTKIMVYRRSNICKIYNKEHQLIKTLSVSTGKPGHETPLGVYQIYEHVNDGDYHLMEDGTYARYCLRFKKGGFMFHTVCYATAEDIEPIPEETAAIGTSASLGCVRLNVADAKWLYNVTSNGCLVIVVDY